MKEFTGHLFAKLYDFISLFAIKHKMKLSKPQRIYPAMWPRIESRSSEQK
jgi:hypothetical protein